VKTRLQQSNSEVSTGKRKGATTLAKEILNKDGVTGLWRGDLPTVVRNVPGVALYFYTLQTLRRRLTAFPAFASTPTSHNGASNTSTLPKLSNEGNLVAGAVARTSVGFLLNPFSVLKARYESSRYAYTSVSGAFMSIAREGPRGLFQGFGASVLRDAPYAGLQVFFYEFIKEQTTIWLGERAPGLHSMVFAWSGGIAGALATLSTNPFDVMKTRMQIHSDDPRYRSLRKTVGAIFQDRGLRGFFDGSSLRVTRKMISSGISWTVYESLLVFWRDRAKYA